ncbi:MAG: hypothetical protein CML37_00385 [Rhodobacteraceae bacterium]|nr:hypothetical protein [Paracoccaceae bacterium]
MQNEKSEKKSGKFCKGSFFWTIILDYCDNDNDPYRSLYLIGGYLISGESVPSLCSERSNA